MFKQQNCINGCAMKCIYYPLHVDSFHQMQGSLIIICNMELLFQNFDLSLQPFSKGK